MRVELIELLSTRSLLSEKSILNCWPSINVQLRFYDLITYKQKDYYVVREEDNKMEFNRIKQAITSLDKDQITSLDKDQMTSKDDNVSSLDDEGGFILDTMLGQCILINAPPRYVMNGYHYQATSYNHIGINEINHRNKCFYLKINEKGIATVHLDVNPIFYEVPGMYIRLLTHSHLYCRKQVNSIVTSFSLPSKQPAYASSASASAFTGAVTLVGSPLTSGQVLTATNSTSASWQTPDCMIELVSNGSIYTIYASLLYYYISIGFKFDEEYTVYYEKYWTNTTEILHINC